MLRYPNFNYQGIEFPAQNLNTMDTLHLDIWTPDCDTINITIVSNSGGGERLVGRRLNLNAWNSINIPLSAYRSQTNFPTNSIFQFKFERAPIGGASNLREIFVDNLYFFTDATLPTLSNFSIPAKMLGDAPFAITPPTSNSTGAFTYTSSNESVATISGDMITIVGGGSSIITATQAAAAPYATGSITTNLIVSVPPPNVAAPTPPGRAASDVVSIFSDAFASSATMNVAPWSGNPADVVQAAGNNTLQVQTNGVFVGFQLSNAINLTDMTYMHFDLWIGGNTQVGGVFNPKLSQHSGGHLTGETNFYEVNNPIAQGEEGKWISFDFPFSGFTNNLTGGPKNIISELIFTYPNLSAGGPIFLDNIYFYRPGILPVKLTSFTAIAKANIVGLNWETATEINNRGFGVERSSDGRTWSELTFVNASPTNVNGAKYSAVDLAPIQGMNFYRLRQTDLDGKFSFSSVKQVNFNGKSEAVSVYPNPSRGFVNVLVNPTSKNVNYTISNMTGISLQSGVLLSEGNVNKLNVQGLPAGVYMLQIRDEKGVSTTRIMVQ
jgi:hypothetical protein